jgi:hypothetical protein
MERAGEVGYNETDFHQLLPIVSPVQNTSVRSEPAPISNASSQSTHSSDKNRELLFNPSAMDHVDVVKVRNGYLSPNAGTS